LILESKGIPSTLNVGYVNSTLATSQEADAFTLAARFSIVRDGSNASLFQDNSVCLNRQETSITFRPKYRSMDGSSNNLKHPSLGAAETAFGRFGPKTYADGVYTVRKSDRVSQYLPSPREIVENVLKKALKVPKTKNISNTLLISFLVYIANDLGHSAPVAPNDPTQRISCCTAGNKAVLPRSIRHASCIPIMIPKDDKFYNASGVRCSSLVRAQLVSSPSSVQFGKLFKNMFGLKDENDRSTVR
jgi:Animal haem peroxidase